MPIEPGSRPGEEPHREDAVAHDVARYQREKDQRADATIELARAVSAETLAQQVGIVARKIELARTMAAPGVPVDVLVVSSLEPGSTQLVDAVYEQLGLQQASRDLAEQPTVDAHGRRTGSERRFPPLSGLQLVELTTEDPGSFASGDTFRRLQVTRPMSSVH